MRYFVRKHTHLYVDFAPDEDGNDSFHTYLFSEQLKSMCGYIGAYMENTPAEVLDWAACLEDHNSSNVSLLRYWGPEDSVYAYCLTYVISNEYSGSELVKQRVGTYEDQFDFILKTAGQLARILPGLHVLVNEQGDETNEHELCILFLYPGKHAIFRRSMELLSRNFPDLRNWLGASCP